MSECLRPEKKCYLTRKEARAKIKTVKAKARRRRLDEYLCACGYWHLGTTSGWKNTAWLRQHR